jgi:hypothetical protein
MPQTDLNRNMEEDSNKVKNRNQTENDARDRKVSFTDHHVTPDLRNFDLHYNKTE